jgi:hypothetical protein
MPAPEYPEQKCGNCRYFVTEQPEDKLGRCVANPGTWSKCPSHLNATRSACRFWDTRGRLSLADSRFHLFLNVLRMAGR